MAFVDIPVDQLPTYPGKTPRPEGFDAFWDAGISEMAALDPQVELIPSSFQTPFAECFDMWWTGAGGARIHAKLLRPRTQGTELATPSPAVLMFHGYYGSCGDWQEKLGYVAAGFTVAAMDVRGQGGLSEDPGVITGPTIRGHMLRGIEGPPEGLLFRNVFLDTAQMARIVMAMPGVDETRVGALGGSQGGGLSVACAALEPRVRRVAPAVPFLSDYQQSWELDLSSAGDGYGEIKQYFRNFDPLHQRETEIFTKLGHIDTQHLAQRIRAEVLMSVGLRDVTCPPSTIYAVFNKITSKKEIVVYPDFGHEPQPGFLDRTFQFMMGL